MTFDLPRPPEWQRDALCQDYPPEIFFPESSGSGAAAAALAKKICGQCPVRTLCLTWALDIERDQGAMPGVYGGLSDRQRRELRKETAA